jgi:hypothetical protein
MRSSTWITIILVSLGAPFCGGTASDDMSAAVTAEQACTDAAQALCKKANDCASLYVTLTYGDEATCETTAHQACLTSLNAPSTAATPGQLETCGRDLGAVSCTDALSRNTPTSCQPTGGPIANGMACGDNWQCASGRCAVPDDAVCGVCADLAGAGATCVHDDDCEHGLSCTNKVCVARGVAGAACDKNHPCANPNVCNGETATAQGTCGPAAAPGADCSTASCSLLDGYFCHPTNKVCQAFTIAQPGEPCGRVNDGLVLCAGSLLACNRAVPTDKTGVCPALVAPGGSCSATAPCAPGAKCIAGACTIADPASCR